MNITYRLTPDRVARPLTTRALILLVGILVAAGVVGGYLSASNGPIGVGMAAVAVLAFLAVVLTLAVRRAIERARTELASFELHVSDDALSRTLADHADIAVRRADVTAIEEHPNGLIVRGANRRLLVPRTVDGFGEVRERLREWAPIQEGPRRRSQEGFTLLLTAGALGAMAVLFTSTNPVVVVPLALVFVIGAVYTVWAVRRDEHVGAAMKRATWWMLLPAFAALLRALSVVGT